MRTYSYTPRHMSKKPINITLPEELIRDAKIQAVREDRTFSGIVEQLLIEYLEKQRKKPKQ